MKNLKPVHQGQFSVNRLAPDSTYLEPNGPIRLQSAKKIETVSLGPHAIHRQYLPKLEREPGTLCRVVCHQYSAPYSSFCLTSLVR
ncbi:MAG: hypothetical protein QNJ58_22950 [Desulfobacterales bacterium]|nr:hypothetical protein [Desulfobacterales bacterium]